MSEIFQQLSALFGSKPAIAIIQFGSWSAFVLLLIWSLRKVISRTISDNSSRYRAKKVVRFVGYFFILLLAVISFTGKLEYLGITIGFISAGIAFALQEVILSVAGWIAIFTNNLYKPGDRIEINGVKGDVIDIGITQTTLMEIGQWIHSDNYNGRIVRISNAFVFKGPVFNYSTDFPFVWDEINLPIRYQSDMELATQIILQVANERLGEYAQFATEHWKKLVKNYLIEDARIEPTLGVSLTDNWGEFNLRYVVDYKNRRSTKHDLFMKILAEFSKTSGKVQLASSTFELTNLPEVSVALKRTDSMH